MPLTPQVVLLIYFSQAIADDVGRRRLLVLYPLF